MDPIAAIVAILTKDRPGEHKQALKDWFAKGGFRPRISEVRKALSQEVKVSDAKLVAMGCWNDAA